MTYLQEGHRRHKSERLWGPFPRLHGKFGVPLLVWFRDLAKTKHTFTLTKGWRIFLQDSSFQFIHTLQTLPLWVISSYQRIINRASCSYAQRIRQKRNMFCNDVEDGDSAYGICTCRSGVAFRQFPRRHHGSTYKGRSDICLVSEQHVCISLWDALCILLPRDLVTVLGLLNELVLGPCC